MSCGLNLNIQACGIFFSLTYTEKGGERKIKDEKREMSQESEGNAHRDTQRKEKRIIFNIWLKIQSPEPVLC